MTDAEIAPPQKVDDLGRKNLLGNRNEKGRAEPAAWNINHLRRFMHPETEHQALYSHFFGDASRSVLWGGLSRHQSKESSKRKTSSIKTFVMIHRTFVQSFRV